MNKTFEIKAKDLDSGSNGVLSYSFGNDGIHSPFEIETINETVRYKSYRFIVTAKNCLHFVNKFAKHCCNFLFF